MSPKGEYGIVIATRTTVQYWHCQPTKSDYRRIAGRVDLLSEYISRLTIVENVN
jgi:hypothetical protein